MTNKRALLIDGGSGRIFCSVPAIKEYIKRYPDTIILSSGTEVLGTLDFIPRLYSPVTPYLFKDILQPRRFIHPEPYHDYNYYQGKSHLIQSYYKVLGLKPPKELPKINLKFTDIEIEQAKEILNKHKKVQGKDKVLIIQPFGASAIIKHDKIFDPTNRSIEHDFYVKLREQASKFYTILEMRNLYLPNEQNIMGNELPLRAWLVLLSLADAFIGIDSIGQHVTYAYDVPSLIFIGSTNKTNICYENHRIIQRNGYPKTYHPFRLPDTIGNDILYNIDALKFTDNEQKDIITEVTTWLNAISLKF